MELTQAASKVCRACMESNLIEEVKIARCVECLKIYCFHFTSSIDPSKCVECCSDVSLHKEVVTKTYTYYNEETDTVTEYKRRARYIKLEGVSWLFIQRKIAQMSDLELELAVEYHREVLNGMLREREERRIKQLHRYANTQASKDMDASIDATKVLEQSIKRTKTIQSSKAAAVANSTMQAMIAGGMTTEKLLELLQKATGGKK